MEFPIVHHGQTVGRCIVTEQGLYWQVRCECEILSDRVERLYYGQTRLAVLEREGEKLTCCRKISKASVPGLEQARCLSLLPMEQWQGDLLGQPITCLRQGDRLLFPYREDAPCPCEPLLCFFEIKDGFWQLPVQGAWSKSVGDDTLCR